LATEVRDFYAHVRLLLLLHDGFGVMVVGNGSLTLGVDVVEREGKKVTSFDVRMSFWAGAFSARLRRRGWRVEAETDKDASDSNCNSTTSLVTPFKWD
jgi:hypothetical protein